MKAIDYVNNKRFTLIQSFLSSHERTFENNDEHRTHHVREDSLHNNAQLFLNEFMLNNHLRMKTKSKLMKLLAQHLFYNI